MLVREEWRNRGQEPRSRLLYPPGRCLGWDRGADAECPAASQYQPRISSVPLSSAGESIKDLPLLFPGTVPQT